MDPRLRFSFHDLRAEDFPFTAELLDCESGRVVWHTVVTGPGALRVPGCHETNGGKPIMARITFADGTIYEERIPT